MTLPVLVDVDGVLADFNQPLLDLLNDKHHLSLTNKDVVDFHIQKGFAQYWDEECEKLINGKGFCLNLKILPGAQEGIQALRENGCDIIFTTSPLVSNNYWHNERQKWLEKNFDASYKDVIFAHQKQYVQGRVLIDDRFKNVKEWAIFNKKPAILFSQPWNEKEAKEEKQAHFHKALCWNGVVKLVNITK